MTRWNENRENFGRRNRGENKTLLTEMIEVGRAQRTANRPSPPGNERKEEKPLTKILATSSTKPPVCLPACLPAVNCPSQVPKRAQTAASVSERSVHSVAAEA
ncbi:UNVERIFIED_CONTAM: hypothetical protein K2H54_041652 [Gekko kuhli]